MTRSVWSDFVNVCDEVFDQYMKLFWALHKILPLQFTRELICSFMVAGAIARAFLAEKFLPSELMRMAQRLNGKDAVLSIFFTDSPSESKDSNSMTPLFECWMEGVMAWKVAEAWSAAQAGGATVVTMTFVAAPPQCRQCREGTVLNKTFLLCDFEVARLVLVNSHFCCPVQLEVLGMVDDEKKQKENLWMIKPTGEKAAQQLINNQPTKNSEFWILGINIILHWNKKAYCH